MKVYLIVALFLGALVVANSLETDEEEKVESPQEQPAEEASDPSDGTEGTEGDTEESEDEDDEDDVAQEKRRLRDRLSPVSCRRLKAWGYCRRYALIRNLCRLTCRVPPPCNNRLSGVSCLRIRSFRRCGSLIARLYCRRTCRHCGGGSRGPCRRYRRLSEANRSRTYGRGSICDKRGFTPGWYRFVGAAGSRLTDRFVPKNRCGSNAPGYMKGGYPRRGLLVSRKVCFNWGGNRCRWSTIIRVKNCGRFYVFYLPKTPVCHLRYCGE